MLKKIFKAKYTSAVKQEAARMTEGKKHLR